MRLQDCTFERWNPRSFSATQNQDLRSLAGASLRADFEPTRPPRDIHRMLSQVMRGMANQNRQIGGPTLKRRLTFANTYVILARNNSDNKLVAALPVGEVALSKLGGLKGIVQRHLELSVPSEDASDSRFYWAGHGVFSAAARADGRDLAAGAATIAEGLLAVGAYYGPQPLAWYTECYQGESLWQQGLKEAGFSPQESGGNLPLNHALAFGTQAASDGRQLWAASSLQDVVKLTFKKPGVEAAIQQTHLMHG